MPGPQITVAGLLKDLLGAAVLDGQIAIQLCGFGSQIPRVQGVAIIAQIAPDPIDVATGAYNFLLWGNDVITPAGTFYTIQLQDANGNVIQTNAYQFNGAGAVDLSALAPFNPPPVAIAVPNPVLLNPAGLQVIAGSVTIQGNLIVTGTITNGGLVAVAYSANPAFNALLGNVFEITLTGNVAGSTIAGTFGGQMITFIVIQDGTGGRT